VIKIAEIDMYCMKEKKHVQVPESKLSKVPFRRDIMAWKGKCPDCGTELYRIIGKKG